MLILVGVTVTTAINGGLFESARKAVIGTSFEKDKEQLTAAIATAYDVTTGIIEKGELKKALGTGWTVIGKNGGPYTVTSPDGNRFKVKEDGTVEKNETEESTKTIADLYCDKVDCANKEHLHKGDYVNYKPTEVKTAYKPDGDKIGSKTGTEKKQEIPQEELNWRILGEDDEGNILLISGTPTVSSLEFFAEGIYYFVDVVNDTCNALYSNMDLGATARNITMNDIDIYLGGNKFIKTTYKGYGDTKTIESFWDYDVNTNRIVLLPEKKTVQITSNGYKYEATSELIGALNREILFGKETKKTYYNWVASCTVLARETTPLWCYNLILGGIVYAQENGANFDPEDEGDGGGGTLTLRPIVSLPSETTTEKIQKKAENVEEKWNDPLKCY